ncbi:MAG: hypothetical protein ACR2MF_05155 [Chthoniobacterales bacterium]
MATIANPADVASIDAIVAAAYDVISGPGKKRDWDRERSLFIPGARLIPTTAKAGQINPDGTITPQVLDVEGFIERSRESFAKAGFFEKEIARRTEQFGHIAHVWSTYESRHQADDPEPFMRGINSIQLLYDDDRWWIVTIYWQQETADEPIPQRYLRSSGEKLSSEDEREGFAGSGT